MNALLIAWLIASGIMLAVLVVVLVRYSVPLGINHKPVNWPKQ